jgi:tetratricopeptide (TPR) repeat protein
LRTATTDRLIAQSSFCLGLFSKRDHASEREKLHITAEYYLNGIGDFERAAVALQDWEHNFPRDDIPPGNLGFLYTSLGQLDLAAQETQKSLQLDPDIVISYENLMQNLLALNRFGEVIYEAAQSRKLDDVGLHTNRYALAFLQSDSVVMAEQARWFTDKPALVDELYNLQQETEAYAGHLAKARELTHMAVDAALRADNKSSAAIWMLEGAYRDELFREVGARERVNSAIKLAPENYDTESFAAFILAGIGEVNVAEALAQDLQKRFPSRNFCVSIGFLPSAQRLPWLTGNHGKQSVHYKQRLPMNSVLRSAHRTHLVFIRFMCVAKPSWQLIRALLPTRNSRSCWNIVGFLGAVRPARLLDLASLAPTPCKVIPPIRTPPIKTSSLSGKTPTQTFPSSSKPRRSTRSCSSAL